MMAVFVFKNSDSIRIFEKKTKWLKKKKVFTPEL